MNNPQCPISLSDAIKPVLAIDRVPVHCNILWPTRDAARNAPKGDIHLAYALESGHLFNTAFDPGLMEYTETYENSLHFSPRFQQYADALARRLVDTYDLHGKHIIEIGSGKGDFLHLICSLGDNRGTGFDPSYEPDQDGAAADDRVTFVQDFYTDQYTGQQADFICCRHVLEHIEHPREFIASVRRSIGDRYDTVVYFEVPNIAYTLRDMGIWDLIYEHVSYFSVHSITRLFIESGFRVLNVGEAYAGQFLGIEVAPVAVRSDTTWDQWSHLDAFTGYVDAFAEQYRRKVETWQQHLDRISQQGQRAVIWGGGSKGVTFLNVLKAFDLIGYVVDINPRKQGKHVAGTGQELVPPEFLRDYAPNVVIIMNPIYQQEIQQTVANLGLSPEFLVV
ncbi:MAG: methyltransferase domain-containing protein [Anaerolineae bacterium]|nr:methyltransferase domain-containing protein [Anaerolineae bacterium]